MPDIGYTSPAADGDANAAPFKGNTITMPEAGQAGVTVTARLWDNLNTAGDSVKACIFNTSDVLLAESAVRTDISTEAVYTFSGGGLATFTPANGVTYYMGIMANDSTVRMMLDLIAAGAGIARNDTDVSTFGPPAAISAFGTAAATDRSNICYMTYTAVAGARRLTRLSARGGMRGMQVH